MQPGSCDAGKFADEEVQDRRGPLGFARRESRKGEGMEVSGAMTGTSSPLFTQAFGVVVGQVAEKAARQGRRSRPASMLDAVADTRRPGSVGAPEGYCRTHDEGMGLDVRPRQFRPSPWRARMSASGERVRLGAQRREAKSPVGWISGRMGMSMPPFPRSATRFLRDLDYDLDPRLGRTLGDGRDTPDGPAVRRRPSRYCRPSPSRQRSSDAVTKIPRRRSRRSSTTGTKPWERS